MLSHVCKNVTTYSPRQHLLTSCFGESCSDSALSKPNGGEKKPLIGGEKVSRVDLQVIVFVNYDKMLLYLHSVDEAHVFRECVGEAKEPVIIRLCVCVCVCVCRVWLSGPCIS